MPANARTSSARTPIRTQALAFGGVGLLLALIVLGYLTFYFGRIRGEEFSPDDFTRREFTYFQLPLFNWQISPIHRTKQTNDLVQHLTNEKLISTTTPTDADRRWDLVFARAGLAEDSPVISQGEARILCSYLDAEQGGKKLWLRWTEEHQAVAKVLWPLVAKLARQELYLFIPELLVAARGAADPTHFQATADRILATQYLRFARTQQALGQHQSAVELFTGALDHAPQSVEALKGRDDSLATLGQNRADLDRAAASTPSGTSGGSASKQ